MERLFLGPFMAFIFLTGAYILDFTVFFIEW